MVRGTGLSPGPDTVWEWGMQSDNNSFSFLRLSLCSVFTVDGIEVKGPKISTDVEWSDDHKKVMQTYEVGSVSAIAGLTMATLGLAATTGFDIGKEGVREHVLGTGFSVGRTTSVSLFGSKS
uniref:Uncharacterized protein n=1 Tax=Oncorhynchus kisutch TaxID=8019 RepID=A0A8C7L7R5_ONCKI